MIGYGPMVILLLSFIAGCQDSNSALGSSSDSTPPSTHEVRYVLDWDLEGTEKLSDGTIRLFTLEGHEVVIRQGWLVNYSTALVPCTYWNPMDADMGFLDWVGGGRAHAAHGGDEDPSMAGASIFEDLLHPERLIFEQLSVPPQHYCKLHYVAARADLMTRNSPTEVTLEGSSLYLSGTFRRDGTAVSEAFVIETDLAYGTLFPLFESREETASIYTGHGGIEITIQRRFSSLFDGVDLPSENPRGTGFTILKNLLQNAAVTLRQ